MVKWLRTTIIIDFSPSPVVSRLSLTAWFLLHVIKSDDGSTWSRCVKGFTLSRFKLYLIRSVVRCPGGDEAGGVLVED